jgi:uncharacterized protein
MAQQKRNLAVVTGASSGIGLELARLAAEHGYDLIIAADEDMAEARDALGSEGVDVEVVQADLATMEGVDTLLEAVRASGRVPEILMANAGHGLGHGFLDQDVADWRHVIDTNITGTLYLIHQIAPMMKGENSGRILITGSIAGFMPGSFQAVYNGTKAFIDSFSFALRNELKETGLTVTCLMPGATDTHFFERADMMDTKVGQDDSKSDPAFVAKVGFKAMMDGEGDVVAGWKNKIQTAIANVTPSEMLAEQHRKMAEPGSGRE